MGVPGRGGLAVPRHSPLLGRAIAAPQLGLGTGSTVRMPHGPRPLLCLSQRPPTLLSFRSPAQTAPSPGRDVPPSTAGPTLSAEALRLGNSGTFTPLPSGDARTRRLRGSSAASSSEDASGRAGRGSAGGHGDGVTVRPPAEDRHPRGPCAAASPGSHRWSRGRSSCRPRRWRWGAGRARGAGACGPGWPCCGTRCCPAPPCPAGRDRHDSAGSPRTGHSQHWEPRTPPASAPTDPTAALGSPNPQAAPPGRASMTPPSPEESPAAGCPRGARGAGRRPLPAHLQEREVLPGAAQGSRGAGLLLLPARGAAPSRVLCGGTLALAGGQAAPGSPQQG